MFKDYLGWKGYNWDWLILSIIAVVLYRLNEWLIGPERTIGYAVYTLLLVAIIRFGKEVP